MGLFGFGKSYSIEDLQREITKLHDLYQQGLSGNVRKNELSQQLTKVLEICKKGNFFGGETVEWGQGCYTSLRNVTPPVQAMIELM